MRRRRRNDNPSSAAATRADSDDRGLAHLRQAELVPRRVAERTVDAVRPLLGRFGELDAPRRQLLVRSLSVVGREQARQPPAPPATRVASDARLALLRQAELVPRRVAERTVDAVRPLLGRFGELDAQRRQLLVRSLSVQEQDVRAWSGGPTVSQR